MKRVIVVILLAVSSMMLAACSKESSLTPHEAFMKQAKSIPREKIPPHPDADAQKKMAESQLAMAVSDHYYYHQRPGGREARFKVDLKSFSVNKELESMEKFGVKTYFWAMPVEGEVVTTFPDGQVESHSERIVVRFYMDPTRYGHADYVPISFSQLR